MTYEVYTDDEWMEQWKLDKAIAAATTEEQKKVANVALDSFKQGLSPETKEIAKNRSRERFTEIAGATGCQVRFDEE